LKSNYYYFYYLKYYFIINCFLIIILFIHFYHKFTHFFMNIKAKNFLYFLLKYLYYYFLKYFYLNFKLKINFYSDFVFILSINYSVNSILKNQYKQIQIGLYHFCFLNNWKMKSFFLKFKNLNKLKFSFILFIIFFYINWLFSFTKIKNN
jgi:hypothetical protein